MRVSIRATVHLPSRHPPIPPSPPTCQAVEKGIFPLRGMAFDDPSPFSIPEISFPIVCNHILRVSIRATVHLPSRHPPSPHPPQPNELELKKMKRTALKKVSMFLINIMKISKIMLM